jgi:hypothetical protein
MGAGHARGLRRHRAPRRISESSCRRRRPGPRRAKLRSQCGAAHQSQAVLRSRQCLSVGHPCDGPRIVTLRPRVQARPWTGRGQKLAARQSPPRRSNCGHDSRANGLRSPQSCPGLDGAVPEQRVGKGWIVSGAARLNSYSEQRPLRQLHSFPCKCNSFLRGGNPSATGGPQKLALDVRRMVENRLDVLVANAGGSRNSNAGAITILDGVRETNAAGSPAMPAFQYEEMGRRVRGHGCHF